MMSRLRSRTCPSHAARRSPNARNIARALGRACPCPEVASGRGGITSTTNAKLREEQAHGCIAILRASRERRAAFPMHESCLHPKPDVLAFSVLETTSPFASVLLLPVIPLHGAGAALRIERPRAGVTVAICVKHLAVALLMEKKKDQHGTSSQTTRRRSMRIP